MIAGSPDCFISTKIWDSYNNGGTVHHKAIFRFVMVFDTFSKLMSCKEHCLSSQPFPDTRATYIWKTGIQRGKVESGHIYPRSFEQMKPTACCLLAVSSELFSVYKKTCVVTFSRVFLSWNWEGSNWQLRSSVTFNSKCGSKLWFIWIASSESEAHARPVAFYTVPWELRLP